MLPIIACGAGIYLGLNFNLLVLLPFSVLGGGAYIASSWSAGHNVFDTFLTLLLPAITIQLGYFLGLTGRPAYFSLLARFNIGRSRQA